jgi:hypothetical protein
MAAGGGGMAVGDGRQDADQHFRLLFEGAAEEEKMLLSD